MILHIPMIKSLRAEETKRQIEREGGTALAATANVADPAQSRVWQY